MGKPGDALLFPRADGGRWSRAHQVRSMKDACKVPKIAPPIGFHGLRHTYASRLAMRAVPMQVIAQQLGHADPRMSLAALSTPIINKHRLFSRSTAKASFLSGAVARYCFALYCLSISTICRGARGFHLLC